MKSEKELFIDYFDEFLRNELIEKCLEHNDKELFMKMTSPEWKNYLYTVEIPSRNYHINNKITFDKKIKYGHFVENKSRFFYKEPSYRIYKFNEETNKHNKEEQDPFDVSKNLCNLSFMEKEILIKELECTQANLKPAFNKIISYLSDNPDALFNCTFVEDISGLNGTLHLEGDVIVVNEFQEDISSFKEVIDVLEYYVKEDIQFFFKLDNSVLKEGVINTVLS